MRADQSVEAEGFRRPGAGDGHSRPPRVWLSVVLPPPVSQAWVDGSRSREPAFPPQTAGEQGQTERISCGPHLVAAPRRRDDVSAQVSGTRARGLPRAVSELLQRDVCPIKGLSPESGKGRT
ncbi:hypothetical protein AAFF_G00248920 [Aldrovandia affinis]|uniref:Uncharacterized protein n=1 Tax=Aldrovandia affinis TaxID=143900 RepID=A0AAD7W3F2_9TELE|nr:hypothetical protein AAFF_G00248920 [Aldrovandia affinis]